MKSNIFKKPIPLSERLKWSRNRSFAFTLAEVLITLTIIGVVAAMTIPQLMQSVQDYQWKQAWKKEYSVINQAYNQMKYDNGGTISEWTSRAQGSYTPNDPFLVAFSNHFSLSQNNLGGSAGQNLSYKTMSGQSVNTNNLIYGNFVLNDGARLLFRTFNSPNFQIWVDVDGYGKGPNTLGKDLFIAVINDTKIVPLGASGTNADNTCNNTPNSITPCCGFHAPGDFSGAGCSAEYLYK